MAIRSHLLKGKPQIRHLESLAVHKSKIHEFQ